jgi:hypothetical protein
MTKLCSVCGTENRDEAQFCRSCGTAFSAQVQRAAAGDGAGEQNVCAECGFQNKPGLRYCANCGMSLGVVADAASGGSPPPLNYPSFAPVAPYPPAPAFADAPPDLPDPDAEIALRQQEAADSDVTAMPFENPPSRSRAPVVIGGVAIALVVAGALAWTYMRSTDPSPPVIGATTPPVAPTAPGSAPAAPPIIVEQAPASAPESVAAPASAVETPPAAPTATAPLDPPPAAARPLPQVGDALPPDSADADAKRVAAERRAKAAREKAERDAKASAERDQNAAAAQREQDAQASRRAEEAQRARPAPPAAARTPPAAAQARGVRDLCAGRGAIAEAVCQSRLCGQPEHFNESICRQLREQDERRRNFGS